MVEVTGSAHDREPEQAGRTDGVIAAPGQRYHCGRANGYLALCQLGRAQLSFCAGQEELSAGEGALVAGETAFTVYPQSGGRVFVLPFAVGELGYEPGNSPLLRPLSEESGLILGMLHRELNQRRPGYQEVARGLIIRLLRENLERFAPPQGRARSCALRLAEIEDYILGHCMEASLAQTAAHFYYHPNTLSRFIRSSCGKSYSDYSRDLRLRRAAGLLLQTPLPVYRIAELCGYSNKTHFYSLFANLFGKTPSEYRRQGLSANP